MDLSRQPNQFNRKNMSWLVFALLVVAPMPAIAQGYQQNQMAAPMGGQNAPATDPAMLKDWFAKYDQVRRQAQMSPVERSRADDILSHGLQILVPGPEKLDAQKLLTNLVAKYDRACNQLKQLRLYPETGNLHREYFKYFSDAKNLFSDYLRVQGNIMAKDQQGNSIMAGLMSRKQQLETTEQQAKATDSALRNRLGIAPYQF